MQTKNFFALMLLFLTSCATILHKKQYDVYVHSNQVNPKIIYDDIIYDLPDTITLKRSKNDINLTFSGDSIEREYTIKSSPNTAFLVYNILWNYAAPIAYIIDLTTPKRFYYGDEFFFDTNDTSSVIIPEYRKSYEDYFLKPYPTKRNEFNVFVSLPHINSFHMKPEGEGLKTNTGFWGLTLGLEYFYKENKYISINANRVSDFFVPIPASPGIEGFYEAMNSTYISISDNLKFNRFTIGYGFCYAINLWEIRDDGYMDTDDEPFENISKSHITTGLLISSYHRILEDLYLGVIFRPTFLKLKNPNEFAYEHLISISLGWKFRINK